MITYLLMPFGIFAVFILVREVAKRVQRRADIRNAARFICDTSQPGGK